MDNLTRIYIVMLSILSILMVEVNSSYQASLFRLYVTDAKLDIMATLDIDSAAISKARQTTRSITNRVNRESDLARRALVFAAGAGAIAVLSLGAHPAVAVVMLAVSLYMTIESVRSAGEIGVFKTLSPETWLWIEERINEAEDYVGI